MPLLEEEEETLLFHSSLIQSSLFLLLPRFRQPSSPFSSTPPHTYLQPTSSGLPLPPQSNHGRHHLPFPISALLSSPPPLLFFPPPPLPHTRLLVEVTEKRGEGGKRGERPSLTQLSQLQHPMREGGGGGGRRTMPAECACFTNKLFASSPPFPFSIPPSAQLSAVRTSFWRDEANVAFSSPVFSTVKLNSNSILLSFLAF